MSDHKFKVGQSVLYTSGPYGRGQASTVYKVTQLLPPEGDDRQYRIKSSDEPHERVVKESQLNRDSWRDEAATLLDACSQPSRAEANICLAVLARAWSRVLERLESKAMIFDYGAPAELFMAKRKGGSRQPLGYRRFATAAEAIRFAIEDFPTMRTLGAWMQVGDERFDGDAIQRLYESSDYPLKRRQPS